jgi:hypothetical protein
MPEVVTCPSCDRKLRLPDDLLGQEVKCPTCGTTFLGEVGPPKPKARVEEKKPAEDNEPTYRLESKRRSRRSRDDDDDDRPSRRRSRRDDDDDDDYDDDRRSRRRRRYDDDDDPWARRRYLTPHRGGSVLTVGIIGLVVSILCCPLVGVIMGIVAVSQGSTDLAAMNRGDMDPDGRGSTLGGLICGVIAIILAVLVFVGWAISAANN